MGGSAGHTKRGLADDESGRAGSGRRGKLNPDAAAFYGAIYASARTGSIAELCRRGCGLVDAEDFFATAFLKVMTSVDPLSRDFSAPEMVSFIKRSAVRVMLDERRRQGQRLELDFGAVPPLTDAGAERPDEFAQERERVAIGRDAMLTLSERDRVILRQRHQMELRPDEILLRSPGLSLRTYRKVIQRANHRVREAFKEIEDGRRCAEMELDLLPRYLDAHCPELERLRVEAHLAHCRRCRVSFTKIRRSIDRDRRGQARRVDRETLGLTWPRRRTDS
ncbi:MAG TPA: sigma-70 family RNA polymerase sigma factor [Solirubrobacterales bacterium]|nr:sigma-70 family RNA polymerase sigma factor [Solirubrobacterales bacterium]